MAKKDKQHEENLEEVAEEVAEEIEGLEELRLQLAQTGDQLKRAVADYHNLEKRVAEGRSEMAGWATGEMIRKILPVLDNLERSIEGASESERQSGWFKGVELSVKQLQSVLREEGLDQIGADGQFDPSLHEAVDIREGEDNQVLEVAQKGYTLNGKVLRPARVIVGRKG